MMATAHGALSSYGALDLRTKMHNELLPLPILWIGIAIPKRVLLVRLIPQSYLQRETLPMLVYLCLIYGMHWNMGF